jgi:hypothetical protein
MTVTVATTNSWTGRQIMAKHKVGYAPGKTLKIIRDVLGNRESQVLEFVEKVCERLKADAYDPTCGSL